MTKTFRNKNFIKKSLIILSISSVIILNYAFPVSALESSTTINNSIEKNYTSRYLNKLDYDKLKNLTDVMNKYPYLSYQYLEAAQAIDKNFNHKDYNGKIINFNDIKEDAKNKYLPKTYTFDDGKFIVKAGDKVSEEKIKRMYWASKEVKAQFMRLIQNDIPLEPKNPDDVLTVVIYNSPTEYKLNQKLYGFNTDNGGIYIEKTGTFFTYERTPEESIYTLEELFRHEFTHYLQGRYLVNGMWGEGDFYKNNELTWYEEGSAEFFAGATRTDGIKPRNSIVNNLKYSNNKMELPDLLHTSYGGWDFYNYGCAFSSYLYKYNPEIFKSICKYIKNNDIHGYKNYINNLSYQSNLNKNYKNYIDELIKSEKNITTPLVSDYYTVKHGYKNIDEMYNEITTFTNLKSANIEKHSSQFFDTFTLTGTYTGSKSNGESSDWNSMNTNLDNSLKELSNKKWLGYKTLTAYFKNYRVDFNGNYQYDVVIHGILNTDPNSKSEQLTSTQNDDITINEIEKNDSYENAMFIKTNSSINASFNKNDTTDIYKFTLDEDTNLNILLENKKNLGINWLLFSDDDLSNYIDYAKVNGTNLESNCKLKKGTYYIYVYTYKNSDGSYKLNLL
ncbi:collagenase [[Eubacterium] tenue]|nr:collagenase [[Eubacterium] tenue]MBC8632822.1 collagenase [[Eubacterium] tenue]